MAGSVAYDGVTNTMATTTGGVASVAAITSADTVTFDGSSPAAAAVTTSAAISCATLVLATGFTGSLTMSNNLTVSGACTLTQGTLNTNGQTCVWGSFVSTGALTRTATFGASPITINGAATCWSTTASCTFSANTANITFSNNGITVSAGAINVNGASLIFTGTGTKTINGTTTLSGVNNLTHNGSAAVNNVISLASAISGTGTLTLAGNSYTNFVTLKSNVVGTSRTLTWTGPVSITKVHIQDIAAAGSSAPWNIDNAGNEDSGNNSSIIFGSQSLENYKFISVGDGMSVSERIK